MAHKVLVNGTAYAVKGGRTLIGGTGYSINKGRAAVNGAGCHISFGPTGRLSLTVDCGADMYIIVLLNGNTLEEFDNYAPLPRVYTSLKPTDRITVYANSGMEYRLEINSYSGCSYTMGGNQDDISVTNITSNARLDLYFNV